MPFAGFPKDLTKFLRELDKNNDREWFETNRRRFADSVEGPMLEFLAALAPRVRKISKHITVEAKKSGGSLQRIFRDTRFSKDKRPYNTQVSARMRHAVGKDVAAPGFYFRIGPEDVHVGTGIWQPDNEALARIRAAIDSKRAAWKKARDDKAFVATWGRLGGESLKRPPAGYDADHPLLEDLKRKDFVGFAKLPSKSLTSKAILDDVEQAYRVSKPLMKFLCDALDLDF